MSIFEDYDQVVLDAGLYLGFEKRMIDNAIRNKRFRKLVTERSKRVNQVHQIGNRDDYIEVLRDVVPDYCSGFEPDQTYKNILLSVHPDNALCDHILKKHPKVDFNALKELHNTITYSSPLSQFWKSVGTVFGIGLALLNIVPKSVIVSIGIDYTIFELSVFWITAATTFCVGILIYPFWIGHSNRINRRTRLAKFFEQIIIVQKMSNSK